MPAARVFRVHASHQRLVRSRVPWEIAENTARLAVTLAASRQLQKVYAMREELSSLWSRSTESSEQLLSRLQDWCRRAEMSGIDPLARFSFTLKRYA